MKHVMVDLETLGTNADAPIIAIGAVVFDDETGELSNEFYAKIDVESAVAECGPIDPDTFKWWMQQSYEARTDAISGTTDFVDALTAFHQYVKGLDEAQYGGITVWGNGASFDNSMLADAYKKSLGDVPWKFWNDRCYRTLKNLRRDVPFTMVGTAHNALDDAKSQALHAVKLLKALNPVTTESMP